MAQSSIASVIDKHGWAVVRVESTDATPDFAYSVGLYSMFRHPEVIIFGLELDVLQQLVNTIGNQIRAGAHFDPGSLSWDVLENYPCAFQLVAREAVRHYMGVGVQFYGGDFPALHCLWPDQEGRFPWAAGTAASYRALQPLLSEGPEPYTHERPEDTDMSEAGDHNGTEW